MRMYHCLYVQNKAKNATKEMGIACIPAGVSPHKDKIAFIIPKEATSCHDVIAVWHSVRLGGELS